MSKGAEGKNILWAEVFYVIVMFHPSIMKSHSTITISPVITMYYILKLNDCDVKTYNHNDLKKRG